MATRSRSRAELARVEISQASAALDQRSPSWIETDAFDRDAFRKWSEASPSFHDLSSHAGRLLPHFDAFLLDLYALLYKLNVSFRPAEAVLPSAALYGPLLRAIAGTPALELLRLQTALDEARAAIGALLLGEKILAVLKEEWLLNRGQMLDAWGLKQQEEELMRLWQQARAVATLADESPRPSLVHLARRLHQEAELAERRLSQRLEDVQRPVRENIERQTARLQSEIAQGCTALEDFEAAAHEWDTGVGHEAYRSPALQVEFGKRLAQNPRLRKLANLVGRMRAHARALRQKALERCNEEMYSVGTGADLGRILPCELAALRHPLRRRDFARRLLEGTLLQYELRGQEEAGRGPLIVCLDVSSSMSGDKDVWAKAVALTLLDIAQRQRRLLHAICFAGPDTPLYESDLNYGQRYSSDPQEVLRLASYFPGGGTDFRRPLEAALHRLQQKPLRKSDVVLITDGECTLEPGWTEQFLEHKRRLGFRLYSVLIDIGSATTHSLRQISDRVASVRQLTCEAGSDLFLAL